VQVARDFGRIGYVGADTDRSRPALDRKHRLRIELLTDPYEITPASMPPPGASEDWRGFVAGVTDSRQQRFDVAPTDALGKALDNESQVLLTQSSFQDSLGETVGSLLVRLFEEQSVWFLRAAVLFLLSSGSFFAYWVANFVTFETVSFGKLAIGTLFLLAGLGFLDVWRRLQER
jgi:hypothetical protein